MGSIHVESPEFFRFMRQLLKIVQQVRGSYLHLIPCLVDNLSNTWMNGMLMQTLDPAALTVLGNEIQVDYELLCLLLTIPK